MQDMLNFMISLLNAIADFLGTPPIIYIVGFILSACIIKILKDLMAVR